MLTPLTARLRTRLNRSSPVARDAALGTRLGEIETEIVPSPGTKRYVDTVNGLDTNDGLSWETAYKTMAKAFTVIASHDTIYFVGKVREQLIAPLGVYGVTIIGADTTPRHDLAASWMAPASGATVSKALCEIIEQGWVFQNILFQSHTTAPAVKMTRAEDAVHPDPSHASFIGCRFAGVDGIWDSGGCYNISIIGCKFYDLTGTAIKVVAGAGIAAPQHWLIEDCEFVNCANGIINGFKWCVIRNNVFASITTKVIDLTGGTAPNFVYDNAFNIAGADFDPAGGVIGVTGDYWSNMLLDGLETGLPAN
jgi:hypothetical protein